MRRAIRVLHVTSGLHVGGAERSLQKLIASMPADVTSAVLSLSGETVIAEELRSSGCLVVCCNLRRRPLRGLVELLRFFRKYEADVLHGWMYHGCLMASFGKWLCRDAKAVVWGIRHSLGELREEKILTRFVIRLLGTALFQPTIVVYNAEVGRASHLAWGYSRHRSCVIRNGVDCQRFSPVQEPDGLIGDGNSDRILNIVCVARFHRMKGLDVLLPAVSALRAEGVELELTLVGAGILEGNAALKAQIDSYGLGDVVRLWSADEISDMAAVYRQFDLLVLPSIYGEGTPNVVLEAMASGIPVVATNVGDTSALLPDSRWLALPGSVSDLRAKLFKFAKLPPSDRIRIGKELRLRAVRNFAEQQTTQAFLELYEALIEG